MAGNHKHCVRRDVHGTHTWKLNDVTMHCPGTVIPPIQPGPPAVPVRTALCGSSQPHGPHPLSLEAFSQSPGATDCPGLTGKAEDPVERALRELRRDLDTAVLELARQKKAYERLRTSLISVLEAFK